MSPPYISQIIFVGFQNSNFVCVYYFRRGQQSLGDLLCENPTLNDARVLVGAIGFHAMELAAHNKCPITGGRYGSI